MKKKNIKFMYNSDEKSQKFNITKTLKRYYDKAEKLAPYKKPVLITGGTGTGKENIAKFIHDCSNQSGEFIPVNVAAISKDFVETFLFGHVKGGYTGAIEKQEGIFEQAKNGTIFLDEIGDASKVFQKSLLRVLQSGDFFIVGSRKIKQVENVRIICATNRDLKGLITQGNFREDLFQRISVHIIHLPELVEYSKEEKNDLIKHMIDYAITNEELPKRDFTNEAIDMIGEIQYTGNNRELSNIITALLIETDGDTVDDGDINDIIKRRNFNDRKTPYINSKPSIKEKRSEDIYNCWLQNGENYAQTAQDQECAENTVRKHIREYEAIRKKN